MIKFLFLAVFLFGCSGNDTISKSQMFKIALKADPNIEVIIPESMEKGIQCKNYGPGCVAGFMAKVRLVTIVLVEFEDEDFAKAEAARLGQYYAKNWLFDDVTDEPVLESFVTKVYGAKRP